MLSRSILDLTVIFIWHDFPYYFPFFLQVISAPVAHSLSLPPSLFSFFPPFLPSFSDPRQLFSFLSTSTFTYTLKYFS